MKFAQKAMLSGALLGATIAGGAVGASVLGTAQAQTELVQLVELVHPDGRFGHSTGPEPRRAYRQRDHRDRAHG